jgi:pimeloyl-ACP methyl ester carboxylesterase
MKTVSESIPFRSAGLHWLLLLVCFLYPVTGRSQSLPVPAAGKTIVFVHGLFQNPESWQAWQTYFRERGYTCYAPAYPYHAGAPDSLRQHIHPALATLTFRQVLDSITRFVDGLPEKPVVIGHSMGGLIVQKLMEAGKISAGVAIAPANPRGIRTLNWQFIRANFRMVNPLKRRDIPCTPPITWFHRNFFNTLTRAEAQAEYDRYFVPESRIIARSSTEKGLEIDFRKPHQPLLFVAGEKDQDLPASLIRKNFDAYRDPHSHREFVEFPGQSHYFTGQPGWEEVAAYIAGWLDRQQAGPAREALLPPVR